MHHILWEGDTAYGHYQVVDTLYGGRPARVLYSGDGQAAQSGMATDDNPDLLFDYNQRLFELVTGLNPKRILLIGSGAFTLPTALLGALPGLHIDAVEPDAKLAELAQEYFDAPVGEHLSIFNTDGRTFLREYDTRYDLVLVDAFTHATIPNDIMTLQAFQAYHDHLDKSGGLAMNIISGYYGPRAETLRRAYAAAFEAFGSADIIPAGYGYSLWLPQNFVLTAQKGRGLSFRDFLRYGPIEPPEVSPPLKD